VTPGVHFGSAQADFIKSARAAGIPAWMLLFSWDNLSTKGALHVPPDMMFVWNERQRAEAASLHGYPPERVVAAGAPRFDEFFALEPVLSRSRFLSPLGLASDAPTLLYLCSSRFVAKHELSFIRRWLNSVRGAADPVLRQCNVIVRPHPDIPLIEDDAAEPVSWPALPRAQGWVSRPFPDERAIVLRTTYATPQAFFECLHHSAAVVGLNTSAELEAGIAGRRVFTVVADDEAVTGQATTLHFHYLLRENGGFVVSAPDLDTHVGHLAAALADASPEQGIRAFIQAFLRPQGDRPVAEVLADELVSQAARPALLANLETTAAAIRHEGTVGDTGARERERPTRLLRIGYPGSSLRVRATHETRKRRRDGQLLLDPETLEWLDTYLQPNEVFYDLGAGIGEYSLIAGTHRNALAVAFEPGFATFKRLCEHVLLNDCRQSVVPLPLALGDRSGLLELQYTHAAGEEHHRLKPKPWRRRPYDAESRYVQPVCADPLDAVIARYNLPRPNHIRIQVRGADAVARGAAETLRDPGVKSVLVIAPRLEVRAALEEAIAASGLSLVPVAARSEPLQRLLFVREPAGVRRRA
jgi:FkbM family methyltransferase